MRPTPIGGALSKNNEPIREFKFQPIKMSTIEKAPLVEEKKETPEEKLAREKQEAFETLLADIRNNVGFIRRGVQNSDDRLIGRAFRQIFAYRKKLDARSLFHAILQNLPDSSTRKTLFLETFKTFKNEAKVIDVKKLKLTLTHYNYLIG
jgi:hypothetical protein